MQELTAQYPTLYTRKFRIKSTDYAAVANKYNETLLFWVNRNTDIAFIKLWPTTKWLGTGITTITFRIHDTGSLPGTDSNKGQYTEVGGNQVVGNAKGQFLFIPTRPNSSPATINPYIGNQAQAYAVYLTCNSGSGVNLNQLTQGEIYVWIGTFRNP